jgi:hypothetical protein
MSGLYLFGPRNLLTDMAGMPPTSRLDWKHSLKERYFALIEESFVLRIVPV